MKQVQIDNFNKVNKEVENKIKTDYNNITLDEIIELYNTTVTNEYFQEDMTLKEKVNFLVNQMTYYIYDYTVYEEKVQKNIARSKKYWNISITLAILFLINSLLGILSLGIILAVGMVGSYFISLINKILELINGNKFDENSMGIEYISHLLKSATIELKREEKKEIENVDNLKATITDEKYEISYSFDRQNLDIKIKEKENDNLVGNYKLVRHK